MLLITKSPLSSKEVSDVVAWLSSPTAQLFIETLHSRMAALQAKAANDLEESLVYPGKLADMEDRVSEMKAIHSCLSILRSSKEKAGDLSLTSIIVDHVRTNHHATTGAAAPHS